MHITELAQILDQIPNCPFHTNKISDTIIKLLDQLADSATKSYLIKKHSDQYGVYFRIQHPKAKIKQAWISHLDHPSIVFDNTGKGYPLGSIGGVGKKGMMDIAAGTYPLRLYSPIGNILASASCRVRDSAITLQDYQTSRSEIIGVWDIATELKSKKLLMRSADNHVPTIIALNALEDLIKSQAVIDITLIFNSVEEIYQLSMTRHMLRGGIPEIELQFDISTFFVVLEAMEMLPHKNFEHLQIGAPTYTNGVLLKVNDTSAVFGQNSHRDNLAESTILAILKQSTRKFQYVPSAGTSDATAISIFSNFPHVICLAVPCLNKHNVTPNGQIKAEIVELYDIETAIYALVKSANLNIKPLEQQLSAKLKQSQIITPETNEKEAQIRKKLLRHNSPRIEHQFFLPNNIWRKILLAKTRVF